MPRPERPSGSRPSGEARPAVVFDLGGTILSLDHPRIERAIRAAGGAPGADWVARAEAAGRHAVDEAVRAGRESQAVWDAFFRAFRAAAGAPDGARDAVRRELESFHQRHHLWNRLVPGVREMLDGVSRSGHRMAVISNSDGRAEWNLRQLGLGGEFEFVLDSAEVGIEKPDPRLFRLAAERLGLPPADCVYVGDILTIDGEGARAAGFGAILLDAYGAYRPEELPAGVWRIVEPSQLPGALQHLAIEREERKEAT